MLRVGWELSRGVLLAKFPPASGWREAVGGQGHISAAVWLERGSSPAWLCRISANAKKGTQNPSPVCVCVCACACTCSAGGCLGATCSEFAHKSHFANSQFTPASWGSLRLSSASYPRPSASLLSWSSLMELVLMERALKSQHEQPAQKLRQQPPPGQAGRSKAAQHRWHLPRLWLV